MGVKNSTRKIGNGKLNVFGILEENNIIRMLSSSLVGITYSNVISTFSKIIVCINYIYRFIAGIIKTQYMLLLIYPLGYCLKVILQSNSSDIYACENENIEFQCILSYSPHFWLVSQIDREILLQNDSDDMPTFSNGRGYYGVQIKSYPFTTAIYIDYNKEITYSDIVCSSPEGSSKTLFYHKIYSKDLV